MIGIWRRGLSRGNVRIAVALLLVVGAQRPFLGEPGLRRHPRPTGTARSAASPTIPATFSPRRIMTGPRPSRRPGPGPDLADYRTGADLYRRQRPGPGAGDRPPVRHDVSLGLWIGPDLEENERRSTRASGWRSPIGGWSIASLSQRSHSVWLCRRRSAERIHSPCTRRPAQSHQGLHSRDVVAMAAQSRDRPVRRFHNHSSPFHIGRACPFHPLARFPPAVLRRRAGRISRQADRHRRVGWPSADARTRPLKRRRPNRPISSAASSSSRWRRATTTISSSLRPALEGQS